MTIQDWGVTYDELEPYYDKFEYLCGTSGKAGNIKGAKQAGGNPFEGPRAPRLSDAAAEAALRPDALCPSGEARWAITRSRSPPGNLSQAYTNPLGVTLGPCTYCGFCEWFGCGNYSKASPQTTLLPSWCGGRISRRAPNARCCSINLDESGKRATGVTYVDSSGEEWEQPAELVLLCAFQLFNVHLLLLSGIGKPYDPRTGEGVIGRNYSYQVTSSVDAYFDNKNFNPFIASGAIGMCIDDFNGDNFDHGPLRLRRRRLYGRGPDQRPADPRHARRRRAPRAGARQWKKAVAENYLEQLRGRHAWQLLQLSRRLLRSRSDLHGPSRPQADAHHFRFPRERTQDVAIPDRPPRRDRAEDGAAADREEAAHRPLRRSPSTRRRIPAAARSWGPIPRPARSTAICRAGTCPTCFVMGATAFPQNAGYNPTGTVGALAYWAADAIVNQYLKHPGPLVQA